MERLRILLVDDHVLFRTGVASLLSSHEDMAVVGQADDGREAIEKARTLTPDVILMDIHMPHCDGLEATRQLKREMPQVKILMLTVADDDQNLFAAIQEGADGYLLKNLQPEQLYEMLSGVRRGEVAISGVMAAKILKEFRRSYSPPAPDLDDVEALSPRETEVLELVAQGATNKEIAEALNVTENTVKIHLRKILEKLHLNNRVQAAVYAMRQGLV